MPAPLDLTGRRFGLLVVMSLDTVMRRDGKKVRIWKCKCDCGYVVFRSTPNIMYSHRHNHVHGCMHCRGARSRLVQRTMATSMGFKPKQPPTPCGDDIMAALCEHFGPVAEPGFSDDEVDPCFWEKWW
jgi:hypothetical protein